MVGLQILFLEEFNYENKSKYKTHKRIFLVVADNTSEMHQALYYAARRAATANGELLYLDVLNH